MTTRRVFLTSLLVAAAWPAASRGSLDDGPASHAERPDPKNLRSGDLIWPKKPGAYVPYHAGSTNTVDQDRSQWIRERDAYVARMRNKKLDQIEQKRVELLQNMDYREFISVYEGDQTLGVPGDYSGGSVYVGHVGIIDVDKNGVPHVVEAMLNEGVVRSTYAGWLAKRSGHLVWHGRINDLATDDGAKIVTEAKKHLERPYDFWNFDLNDDRGFYCSKLVWLSVYRALGFPLDGKRNARRRLWLSPKQVLYLSRVDRLHVPGDYGRA